MLEGVSVHVRPVGEIKEVRAIVPVKWFTGVMVMVEVAAVPVLTLALVGVAATVKSVTATVTLVE